MAKNDYYFQILVANRQGYISELQEIFSQHLDIHQVEPSEHTNYLHTAMQNGSANSPPTQTIAFYLAQKLNVNLQDKQGNTPLHHAFEHGNVHGIVQLIQADAHPGIANHQHIRPLDLLDNMLSEAKRIAVLNAILEQAHLADLHTECRQILTSYQPQSPEPTVPPATTAMVMPTPVPSASPLAAVVEDTEPETPMTLAPDIGQYIGFLIEENILLSSEIVQNTINQFGLDAQASALVQTMVREQKQAFIASQKSWPSFTDCDKLLLALHSLFAEGIIALPAAGISHADGLPTVMDFQQRYQGDIAFKGYCFFTSDDIRHALEKRQIHIHFGHLDARINDMMAPKIGAIVKAAIVEKGLKASWNGQFDTPITISPFLWKNRVDLQVFKAKFLR